MNTELIRLYRLAGNLDQLQEILFQASTVNGITQRTYATYSQKLQMWQTKVKIYALNDETIAALIKEAIPLREECMLPVRLFIGKAIKYDEIG